MSSRNLPKWVGTWNRKVHIYIGLYFLLFIWLFSVSGLLLNHHWEFSEFWPQREESSFEREVQIPAEGSDLARARDLMAQLDLSGEVEWLKRHSEDGRFHFRVTRPGKMTDVETDPQSERATLKLIELNTWGVLTSLHQFTGVRMNAPDRKRDWLATHIWSFSIDALCAGLIILVVSSLFMWYQLEQKRGLGILVLSSGILCCCFFVFGLALID